MKRWSVMQRCIRLILSLVISLQFILYIIANIPRSLQLVVVETLPRRMVDACLAAWLMQATSTSAVNGAAVSLRFNKQPRVRH